MHIDGKKYEIAEWVDLVKQCRFKNMGYPFLYIDERNTHEDSRKVQFAIIEYIYSSHSRKILSKGELPPKL